MPLCYVCPNVPDIQAGKFKDLPWEETPCGKCHWTGNVPHNKGCTHISFDLMITNCKEKENSMDDAETPDETTPEQDTDKIDLPDLENDGVLPDAPDHAILVKHEKEIEIPSLAGLSQKRSLAFIDFFGEWLRLSPIKRDIIAKRISEPAITSHDIAISLGVTEQHVCDTIKEMRSSGKLVPAGSVRIRGNKKRKAATEKTAAA